MKMWISCSQQKVNSRKDLLLWQFLEISAEVKLEFCQEGTTSDRLSYTITLLHGNTKVPKSFIILCRNKLNLDGYVLISKLC